MTTMGRKRITNRHLPPRVYLNHGAYYFHEKNGPAHHLGRDLATAMVAYAKLIEVPDQARTMHHLLDRYMVDVAPQKAPRTYKDNQRQVMPLRAFFGDMRPSDIRPQHVYQFLDLRGQSSPVQANREKALLSHVFSMAMRWGIIDRNPCQGVKRITEKPRDRYIEDTELEAFCSVAPPILKVWCAFKYLTGLRQQDMLNIRMDQIRDDGIHIDTKKTGKKIIFKWSDELKAVVDEARGLRGKVAGLYLFCNRRGQPYTGNGIRTIWQKAMRKAMTQGALAERFTEHDIRAKAATDADAAGIDARRLLAHENQATTDRYIKSRKVERVAPLRRKPVNIEQ